MDIFILLATMLVCFVIGMPIAYSLALAAIVGAWSIGIPLEAVMLKISDGVSKVAMLTIPFFVLAGAIMAEGGMARRLVAFADVLVGFTRVRGGLSIVNVLATTFLSGISGFRRRRYVCDRVGDDPANGEGRLSARIRNQSHHHVRSRLCWSRPATMRCCIRSPRAARFRSAPCSWPVFSRAPARLLADHSVCCHRIPGQAPHGQTAPLKDALRITIDAAWGLVTLVIILGGILGGILPPSKLAPSPASGHFS